MEFIFILIFIFIQKNFNLMFFLIFLEMMILFFLFFLMKMNMFNMFMLLIILILSSLLVFTLVMSLYREMNIFNINIFKF